MEKQNDDGIVDEVEEEDALRMIDEEIMNTAIGKTDARKIKDLINKIDGGATRAQDHFAESTSKSAMDQSTGGLSNSGSFSKIKGGSAKSVDQQSKFSSSSKVVVSKYSKNGNGGSKQNLHESSSIFGGGRKTPTNEKKYENEPEEQDEPDD